MVHKKKRTVKLDRIFSIRKFSVLKVLIEHQPQTHSEIAVKLGIERVVVNSCLVRYRKERLVEKINNFWFITVEGIKRYAYLKARKELEGEHLRLPGMIKKHKEWVELQEEHKRKKEKEIEEKVRRETLLLLMREKT